MQDSDGSWSRHPAVMMAVVAATVSALGVLMDRLLFHEGATRTDLVVLSNTITGVIAGIFFYQMARHEKMDRDLIRERMRTIAELNHHIRNALQVIKFWGETHRSSVDAAQLQLINDSVNRIEWALREVLPRYPVPATPPQTSGSAQGESPKDPMHLM